MPLDDQKERTKAIDNAVGQIEKQFGKGSIMRLGQRGAVAPMEAISTGSISIDERGHAAAPVSFGNDLQRERRLAG